MLDLGITQTYHVHVGLHLVFLQVLDLTKLIGANRGPLADPLIAAAGTDVSHWFSIEPPARNGGEKARTSCYQTIVMKP